MTKISTHVLDLNTGKPAANVALRLEWQEASGTWRVLQSAVTDHDGRCSELFATGDHSPGVYRLVFDTGSYFATARVHGLYPLVEIVFEVRDHETSFHIPLLLSPNGYTTYRGS